MGSKRREADHTTLMELGYNFRSFRNEYKIVIRSMVKWPSSGHSSNKEDCVYVVEVKFIFIRIKFCSLNYTGRKFCDAITLFVKCLRRAGRFFFFFMKDPSRMAPSFISGYVMDFFVLYRL